MAMPFNTERELLTIHPGRGGKERLRLFCEQEGCRSLAEGARRLLNKALDDVGIPRVDSTTKPTALCR